MIQRLDDAVVKKDVVDQVYKALGRNFDNLFEVCDINKDGCVNILDIKAGLKGILFKPKEAKLINPFVAQIKKVFRTYMIDKITFIKFFKLYDGAAQYREAMIKLKDQIDIKDGKSGISKLEKALFSNASAKGVLSKEGLDKSIKSLNLDISPGIIQEITNDVEKRYQILNVKSIVDHISTNSIDSEDVNAINQAVDLVAPVVRGINLENFDFVKALLEPKLKAINNSKLV